VWTAGISPPGAKAGDLKLNAMAPPSPALAAKAEASRTAPSEVATRAEARVMPTG
jgi:hypothetical protein